MLSRVKTFLADGTNPNGRLFAGDLNAIQDAVAAISDLAQALGVGTIALGEAGLQIVRYGSLEARVTGALRVDSVLRGLGGIISGAFTTTQRNAISLPPYGLLVLNTTTNQLEWNSGTAGSPSWHVVGPSVITARLGLSVSPAVQQGSGISGVVRNSIGDYTITYATAFASPPIVVATSFVTPAGTFVQIDQPSTGTQRILTYDKTGALFDGTTIWLIAMAAQ